MSTPAKRKAESPAPGSSPQPKPAPAGLASPTPASPERASTGPASPKAASTGPSTPGPASPKKASGASSPAAEVDTSDALTGAHWLEQEELERSEDADSSLGSDAESSTASVASSIFAYRTILGRTYHSDAATSTEYWAPNDDRHLDSLEIYYHGVELLNDFKLHMSPLKDDIERVLDIGTGKGYWAIDFADKFPNCEVIGTDISPVQPSWVPPNVRFEIDDASKPWTYAPNSFDLVHIRFLVGAIEDWDALYREAYKACKPGGWIEHYDHSPVVTSDDGSVKPGSALDTYGKLLAKAARKIGRDATLADNDTMEEGMKAAGFVNVQTKRMKMPLSPWSADKRLNDVGAYARATLNDDVEGVIQFLFSTVLGWTQEEINAFGSRVRRELLDMSIHGYYHWKYVWAQKPEDAE
ncbi:S-adenosyl-L-methionine-dependent methyltransferase [Sordaria brevicollis]|uniref:S-adenosyl-L-methionine-dependent methyltransferase n=1 Tax=Sordaria brevicollis TaxID=83679 RepID=A0AAE0P277_SORBR|nr:S-adenosyl-L-methionine-dependent methyltransferase [Sordaria brevicollis]